MRAALLGGLLALVLAFPAPAQAGFAATHDEQASQATYVTVNQTLTRVEAVRLFTLDSTERTYIWLDPGTLEAARQQGLNLSVTVGTATSNGTLEEVLYSASGVNRTDPIGLKLTEGNRTAIAILSVGLPPPAQRHVAAVTLRMLLALDENIEGEGAGGSYDPTISTSLRLQFTDHTDSDGDGLPDDWETLKLHTLEQSGSDDPDRDGCNNLCEYRAGTDPLDPNSKPDDLDADGDGLPDAWERRYFKDILQSPLGDPDEDGCTNQCEFERGTDPTHKDALSSTTTSTPVGNAPCANCTAPADAGDPQLPVLAGPGTTSTSASAAPRPQAHDSKGASHAGWLLAIPFALVLLVGLLFYRRRRDRGRADRAAPPPDEGAGAPAAAVDPEPYSPANPEPALGFVREQEAAAVGPEGRVRLRLR